MLLCGRGERERVSHGHAWASAPPRVVSRPPIQRGEASGVRVTAPAAPRAARTPAAAAPRGTAAHGVGGSRSLGKSRESKPPSPGGPAVPRETVPSGKGVPSRPAAGGARRRGALTVDVLDEAGRAGHVVHGAAAPPPAEAPPCAGAATAAAPEPPRRRAGPTLALPF